jgi:hypothetical protein
MTGNTIHCSYSDPEVNRLLADPPAAGSGFSRHFNQVEEFFLRLRGEYAVPQLPIHHDVRRREPDASYRRLLAEVLQQLVALAPEVFRGLSHVFDPTETLRPSFFSLYRIDDRRYLYLVRVDLMYRPQVHRVLHKGTNDFTPAYSTDQLFLEAILVPLEEAVARDGRVHELKIEQTISNTWIGEKGRGYFVQGIWIDNDLTRFFSKLFLPPGARLYPFFPFVCKYKTVCQSVIRFDAATSRRDLPLLHRVLEFLRPSLARIESSMKSGGFSEDNPMFQELKARVPDGWHRVWEGLRLEPYLNDQDMKEFRVDESPA